VRQADRDTPDADASTADREIVVSRILHGPAHVVFKAFTEARHLGRWWGPDGFSTTTHAFEFHPGGIWDFTMHGPDGTDYANWIEWLEISPPERLVFRHGERADDPNAFVSTVTIKDLGGHRSEIELRTVLNTREQRDEVVRRHGAIEGAEQTLGRLAEWVSDMTDVTNDQRKKAEEREE
jgi:uncharacterized protein YndB with AHSA1/START domain